MTNERHVDVFGPETTVVTGAANGRFGPEGDTSAHPEQQIDRGSSPYLAELNLPFLDAFDEPEVATGPFLRFRRD